MNLVLKGIGIPSRCWKPLKSIKRSFKSAAKRTGVGNSHRFHDQRARYVTEVSKVASASITQKAARHADPSTTAMYISIADDEVAAAVNAASRAKPSIRRSVG
jgi:integrase